ncbi:hypothetical protein C8Q73DRAFT_313207 [Cubamyces lactineus]|nr:hypothetical protein C8Q73DRAFT_313207 [Cubamyces lactineus]
MPCNAGYVPVVPRFADYVKFLRITRGCSLGFDSRRPLDALLPHSGAMPTLETLVVRATSDVGVLDSLCFLLEHSSQYCPSLHTVIFSVLRPCRSLEDLHALFHVTGLRATALGKHLQRLIICSPTHAGPDYSVYGHHGVDCITFSSSDAGSSKPGSMWTQLGAELAKGTRPDPIAEELIWGNLTYEQAWAWCKPNEIACVSSRDPDVESVQVEAVCATEGMACGHQGRLEVENVWEAVENILLLLQICCAALIHGGRRGIALLASM